MEKKYWKGVEELRNDAEFVRLKNNEFFENLPVDEVIGKKAEETTTTPRRDFLKFLGFSVAAASLAACEAPVRKTIPYVVKPEEIVPGVPNYYASTFSDGHDYASIIVKTREGRPIKIEGNELSSINKGSVSARVQASVLSLYDNARLTGPKAKNNSNPKWEEIDSAVKSKLESISAAQGKIRILSASTSSPSTKKVIADFTTKYPTTKHVVYDAVSYYGMLKANMLSFGKYVIPSYHFENADVIVAFSTDFLANWISPVEHARQYVSTRKLNGKKTMSRHIHFEARLSLTGSNADNRYKLKPSEQGSAVASLYNKIASLAGASTVSANKTDADDKITKVAEELWKAKGKALVVSGSNDVNEQVLVNAINNLLGSYGSTIDIENHTNLKQGNDEEVVALLKEMNNGEVAALIIDNCNPSYTLGSDFNSGLSKVGLKISFADREDETAAQCDYVCPDHHYLEAWNDAEPKKNSFSLCQPTIAPLFNTRQAQQSLMVWVGSTVADYHTYIQENWKANFAAMGSFETFWEKSLQDGVYEGTMATPAAVTFSGNVADAANQIGSSKASDGLEVVVYEKTGIGNGNQSNNPWLLEMPDPISKVCWDNYITVSPAFAKAKGLLQNNIAEIKAGNVSIKAPVFLQPGMADNTIGLALGYGRTSAGKAGNGVGTNAYPLVNIKNGCMSYYVTGASLNKTVEADHALAATQTHHTMMGRALVKETTLAEYIKDAKAGNEIEEFVTPEGKKRAEELNLWATEKYPGFDKPNHFWGLSIDLNSCIGCGACVVACQAENNVAVVGRDEIGRSREMHWIRIDRYYSSDMTNEVAEEEHLGKRDKWKHMEDPSENPEVVFQPVMCQHCNHAPCETVCPVVATTHSSEGLNMMAYNRCVGTRYCANNCPYKVRRFNWFKYSDNADFDYNMNNDLGKMVLNPDVVVRSRGVMEKCSMCVQRIQYGKLEAKKAGKRPGDGDIMTACAQTCPTHAITFGDYNNAESELSKAAKDERKYYLLEELDVQPSVQYLVKVKNKENETSKKEA